MRPMSRIRPFRPRNRLQTQPRVAHRLQRMHRHRAGKRRPSLRQNIIRLDWYQKRARPLRRRSVLRLLHFLNLNLNPSKHHATCRILTRARLRRAVSNACRTLAVRYGSPRGRCGRYRCLPLRHRLVLRLFGLSRAIQSRLIPCASLSATVGCSGQSRPIKSNQIQ